MEIPTMLSLAVLPMSNIMKAEERSDGSYKLSGIEGKFMSIVLEALGIAFKIVIPKDMKHGVPGPNNNWTGMIGLVQRGEADIAMTAIAPSEKQLKVIDMSSPYFYATVTFAMKIPSPGPVVNAFQYTFTGGLWISVFLVFLFYPIVYSVITNKNSNYSKSFFLLLKCFLGQSFKLEFGSLKEGILMGTWLIFATIILFSYSEVLMSLKAIPPEGKIYRNFQELSKAVKKGKLHCYVLETSRHAFPRNIHQKYIVELEEIINQNQWYIERSPKLYIKLINEGHAVIAGTNFLRAPFGEELFIADESLIFAYPIMALSKTFCCKNRLNKILSRLTASGIHSQFSKEHYYKLRSKFQSSLTEDEAVRPIHFKEIYGVFILLLMGYFLSSFVLLIEIIVSNVSTKSFISKNKSSDMNNKSRK